MFEFFQFVFVNGVGEFWVGFCCKMICDYNYWGVKIGLFYICCNEVNVVNEKVVLG